MNVLFQLILPRKRVTDTDTRKTAYSKIKNPWPRSECQLKGQCHEIFDFWFFSWISFPQASEYTIMAISNFFENSRCTALPRAEFFIEPPPDTQQKRRQGERGIGVTRGSYLLLTSPPPPFPPTHCAPAALSKAALSGHAPPLIVHSHGQKSVIFRKSG